MRAGDVGQNAAMCCSGSYIRAILERKMSCRVACEAYIYICLQKTSAERHSGLHGRQTLGSLS